MILAGGITRISPGVYIVLVREVREADVGLLGHHLRAGLAFSRHPERFVHGPPAPRMT